MNKLKLLKKIIPPVLLILFIPLSGSHILKFFKKSSGYLFSQEIAAVVLMTEDGFSPTVITVKNGSKVIFKNQDQKAHWPASNLHPTHGIYPEFDPQRGINPGEEWSFIFDKAGSWRYHDHLFPATKGIITVEE